MVFVELQLKLFVKAVVTVCLDHFAHLLLGSPRSSDPSLHPSTGGPNPHAV
jgi:hypothetical protein